MPAKAYVVFDGYREDERVRLVTMSRAVADRMIELDQSLRYEDLDLGFSVPDRRTVYIVAGEPGAEPRVTEVLCWPWDYLLHHTVKPDVRDRRIPEHRGLLPPALESKMVQHLLGLAEPPGPPPTIVVRCQNRERALEAYRLQASSV